MLPPFSRVSLVIISTHSQEDIYGIRTTYRVEIEVLLLRSLPNPQQAEDIVPQRCLLALRLRCGESGRGRGLLDRMINIDARR